MNTYIRTHGKIVFEPTNITNKHHKQSSWKKSARLTGGSLVRWIAKRHGLILTLLKEGDKQWKQQ